MFQSIFIGLSGMNAYSNGLRQISNNITNLNSTGFKSSDVSFADLFGRNGGGIGGSGQGVQLSESRVDFAQGELRQTDRDLDLAVDGEGFLVLVKDNEFLYTRTGSFEIDRDGFVVLAGTDFRLTMLDASGQPASVSVDAFRTHAPSATTRVSFADNLSSTATSYAMSDMQIFDALGAGDNWKTRFERTQTSPAGEWTMVVTNGGGTELARTTVKFNNGTIDPATAQITVADAAANRSVIYDFSQNVTSFSSGEVSTLRAAKVDGFATGEISAVRMNDKGELEIGYTNSQTKSLGPVTLASFRNPQSLVQRSGGLFAEDGTTGGRQFLTSASDSVGRVLSRRAEASNVDLSGQFGDLILVQRGFQASSQVVSVSNDMIQQLFGIRGQG